MGQVRRKEDALRLAKRLGVVVVLLLAAGGVLFWQRPVRCADAWVYTADWLRGVRSHEVVVAGHRVHYETEGPAGGQPVVLVHGLGGRAEDWRDLAPYLAKAGYRVYLPDLLGYGRSEKPKDFSYSVHDEAAVVAGFMDALGLKQVDLGGWSMGGAVVQHVAADEPQRITRLLLFDAAGLYELPKWDLRLFTPANEQQLTQLYALLMPHPPNVPAFVSRDILRVSEERAWIIHRALDSMLTGQDATDKLLPALRMPMLIVWGSQDQITPESQGEEMHKLAPQSELDVIPECGHLAPGQCAGQIAPAVLAFLKR